MSATRRRILLAGILSLAVTTQATTAAFIVTPEGIVGATDNLLIGVSFSGVPARNAVGAKIALIHQRFLVACIGLESATNPITGADYNFRTWVRQVEAQLSSNASFSDFQNAVTNQAQKTFTDLDIECAMQNPEFRRKFGQKETLAEYVIAGYAGPRPKLLWIHFDFDWFAGKLREPVFVDESPREPHPDFAFAVEGVNSAVATITDQTSSAYKQCLLYAGPATDKLLSMTPPRISEATLLVEAFIRIEADAEPNEVGRSMTLVTIPVRGFGRVEDYSAPAEPVSQIGKAPK